MASVRKLDPKDPKSPWVCEYTDASGKRRRITPKTGLKKDAEAHKRKVEAELDQGIHQAVKTTVTVEHAAREYLMDCQRRWREKDRMSGYALKAYDGVWRRYVQPKFGSMKLTDLTTDRIDVALREKVNEGMTPTAARMHSFLWNLIKFSMRKRWVKRNCLADEPTTVPINVKAQVRVPTLTDIQALLSALEERPDSKRLLSHLNRRVLVTLGVFGGLRKGEIAGLQWENVDFEAGVIHIRHSLSQIDGLKGPKSESGRRTIHMTAPIREALMGAARYWVARETIDLSDVEGSKNTYNRRIQASLSKLGDDVNLSGLSGFVLRTAADKPYYVTSIYQGLWVAAMKAAGLMNGKTPKFSVHALRHAAASLFIGQGLTSFRLKHVIGHKSEAITFGVYGHLFPEDDEIKVAAEAIATRFNATQTRHKPVRT